MIGVDGMDPGFVQRHWTICRLLTVFAIKQLPRLATTTPPESRRMVHVHHRPQSRRTRHLRFRDSRPPNARTVSFTDRTTPTLQFFARAVHLPLARSHVESLRKGKAFWETLGEHGIPVTVIRMPSNYPPSPTGNELAGMETPDLRGTQSTFSFYTDNPTRLRGGGRRSDR